MVRVPIARQSTSFPRRHRYTFDRPMKTHVHPVIWRRYGYGGPPEPWGHGAQRDLDRLATSYYIDVLETRRVLLGTNLEPTTVLEVEEVFTLATRHKQEIDFALRHWATPAERDRVEDRLGSLMRAGRRLRAMGGTALRN